MWILRKFNEDTIKYLISEKGSYSIGRKNCDIILDGDASISRKHCVFNIAKKNDCKFFVDTLTGAWIVDENSKYGTYLKNDNEWQKVNPSKDVKLSSGSIIKFGLLENIWSLEYKPIVACVSAFSAEQKKEVENALMQIDGELRNAWSDNCSFVIVNEITLTIKVVLALINGIPIVNINYVKKLVECIKNQTSLPDSKEYRPEMKEKILDSSLVSLDPKDTRKDLFKNQLFIFPTAKQLETLKNVIISAGGKVDLLSFSKSWDKFGEKNIVMIQLPIIKSSLSNEIIIKFQELEIFLKNKHKKRVVPESEIAQAVAYASTEKYCNPNVEYFQIRISNKEPDLGVVLVEETQEYSKKNVTESCIIPCSSTSESFSKEIDSHTPTSSRKRNHSPDQLSTKSKIPKNKNDNTKKTVKEKRDKSFKIEKESVCQNTKENTTIKKKQIAETSSKTSKNFLMTDYFNNINKNQKELSSQQEVASQIEINTSSFWGPSISLVNNKSKRQLSPKKDFDEDLPQSKKSKQLNKIVCDESKSTINEKTSTSANIGLEENVEKTSTSNAINLNENEKDFTSNFIGKDLENSFKSSAVDRNNTVYSLSIISLTYLQENGTLIDPPTTPVNVKKFKKQKIYTLTDLFAMKSLEKEPEVGNWLIPHAFN